MPRTSRRRPTPPPPHDDPAQSRQFIGKANEIGTYLNPEAFEQVFLKIVHRPNRQTQPQKPRRRKK